MSLAYTDDTVQTMAVSEELIEAVRSRRAMSENSLLHRLSTAWRADPGRGYGGGVTRVFAACLAGSGWEEAVQASFGLDGSWGNGAAMRVAPVAVVSDSLQSAARLASRTAQVTHAHPLGIDGAVLQAVAVAQALGSNSEEPLDATRFLGVMRYYLHTSQFTQALARAQALVGTVPHPRKVAGALGNSAAAVRAVPTALMAFLLHPDSPVAAIGFAVRCGGDTDTIAAMAGALAGARCGASALPEHWLRRLEAREALLSLADQLTACATAPWD